MVWAIAGTTIQKTHLAVLASMSIRIGLRTKLVLLSSFLFTIPWFGYQYVWEMEKYLRYGQEQTLVGTARALATALHERPNLFNKQASFLPSVERGKDLYGFELNRPIQLDGKFNDWPNYQDKAHRYNENNILWQADTSEKNSLSFTAAVGKYDKFLYLFFDVIDNKTIYRGENIRSIFHNDHIIISVKDNNQQFHQYAISNKNPGWVDAFKIDYQQITPPVPMPLIQGTWQTSTHGYTVELRIPLTQVGDNIAFAIADVDEPQSKAIALVGSANTSDESDLGTILVPSPEIERIVKGMSNTHSSIWVVDRHQRVLASAGNLANASGVWRNTEVSSTENTLWQQFEQNILHPLYYTILTRPSKDFIDKLYDESNLTGKHIDQALNGKLGSHWRLTTDKKAVILSAAYPIFIDNQVQGAVIVEETTNGIKTLRNKALEKLFTSILAILLLGTLAFFFFASNVSSRIRLLRNQAEQAIDEHGRVQSTLSTLDSNDEIGDLSRSFATAVSRLSQYNHYLENMSSRLSHELRTPIAVVRTSLENLSLQLANNQTETESPNKTQAYIERAQSGIARLNHIITSMTEATRVEQMLQQTKRTEFIANEVVKGCVQGFEQIHPHITFELIETERPLTVSGSPEHFAQLLEKVISNAVEFTQDKQVQISLFIHGKGSEKSANDKTLLKLEICNHGPLLPENMRDKLFNSMVSIRAEQQTEPHLGLGLFIARLITEFHRGTITADNNQDKTGVCVEITIPTVK